MPVFISHRHTDDALAKTIRDYLVSQSIKCYLDDLDPDAQTTDDITRVVLDNLSKCTHLLAVVSLSTVQSWWVPFEVGAGTVQETRIATYKTVLVQQLPQYLTKWPVLSSTGQLPLFVKLYKQDRRVLQQTQGEAIAKSAAVQTANDFHSKLKAELQQR